MKIGKKIRKRRQAEGLTQAELAELLRTTRVTVGRWERDQCAPTGAGGELLLDWLRSPVTTD